MKTLRILGARLALSAAGIAFSAQAFAAQSVLDVPRSFDDAWKELQTIKEAPLPAGIEGVAVLKFVVAHGRGISRLARDIFEDYPDNPRRWEAAGEFFSAPDPFVYALDGDPARDGLKAYQRDDARRAALNAYARALFEQMMLAKDVSPEAVAAAIPRYFSRLTMTPGTTPNDLRTVVDEFARRFPSDPMLAHLEQAYYAALQVREPAAADEHLGKLLQSENAAVKAMALAKTLTRPGAKVDMKFTAVDGREVDVAELRGKVVLIDFWATWCGPCIAELPNVKAVYRKYHDQGFEVIGISLENARLSPTDTPEQAAQKLEKARKVLTDFTARNEMPWPQFFDGKFWQNEFSRRYGINGIPAMLLLDRAGLVASQDARGDKLEAEVSRLLKP